MRFDLLQGIQGHTDHDQQRSAAEKAGEIVADIGELGDERGKNRDDRQKDRAGQRDPGQDMVDILHKAHNINEKSATIQYLFAKAYKGLKNNVQVIATLTQALVLKEDFSSWTCDGINFSVNYIEYVHQLQNLYYLL